MTDSVEVRCSDLLSASMDCENGFASGEIGGVEDYLAIEATRSEKRGIKNVWSIRC